MPYKFPDTCPYDGEKYKTVQALAQHIFTAHIQSKCPECRNKLSTNMIDSWVHTCEEHNVPEYEFFIRCEKCGAEFTLIAHSYDDRGEINHFLSTRV